MRVRVNRIAGQKREGDWANAGDEFLNTLPIHGSSTGLAKGSRFSYRQVLLGQPGTDDGPQESMDKLLRANLFKSLLTPAMPKAQPKKLS